MATVSTLANPVSANVAPRHMDNSVLVYTIWHEIDLAEAAAAKGSALAAADVIEAVRVPQDSMIIGVWAEKTAAMTGTSTDLTFDIGITGGDVDQWVDGWDFDGAAVGSYAPVTATKTDLILSTADSVDILFATQTGTVTGGKVVVGVVLVDLKRKQRGAIAQPKS